MNIDKIYKPLKLQNVINGKDIKVLPVYNNEEVKELEEQHKSLLKYHIDLMTWLLNFYGFKLEKQINEVEELLSMKWEEIIK